MKNIKLFLIIWLAFLAFYGCSKKSAIEQLNYRGNDPVEAMRLPPKDGVIISSEQSPTNKPAGPSPEDIDLSRIKDLQKGPLQKFVTTKEDHISLLKGPGVKFQTLGSANKGEKLKVLRVIPSTESEPIWYLVEYPELGKVFISSLKTELSEEKIKAPRKVSLKEGKKISSSKVRSVLRTEPKLPKELKSAKHITLNFEGTDIYDIITTFCDLLKINYIIEGDISGKVTLQTFSKIPAKDLYSVFEQILAVNNITVTRSGKFYRFLPIKEAARKPLSLYYGNDSKIPYKDRLIIQIIPLKHLTPPAMKKVISPILSPNAQLIDVPETNNLILIELGTNIRRISKVIKALDVDKLASSDIHLFKIAHSDSDEVVDELNEIFTSIGYGAALEKSLTFLSVKRLNSILVVSSLPDINGIVDFWIQKLDQPASSGSLSTFVYYIQNAEADKLSTILTSIFDTKKSKKTDPRSKRSSRSSKNKKKNDKKKRTKDRDNDRNVNVKGSINTDFEGEIHIIPDQDTNSLVIRTLSRNYPAILELIKKLDLLPQQVLIEVLILDLTLDEETRLGIEWALKGTVGDDGINGGDKIVGGGSGSAAVPTLGSQIGDTATSLFAPGASFFVQRKDKLIALLQAFSSDSKINIIANPILVTSDNKEANISITDDIPIQSSTISTPTAGQPLTQTSIEFRDVGIKLGILPKINRDNFVNLKIDQEISDQGPIIQNTPSFITRTVKTEVVLKDNEILVMGGLMRTNSTETISGVPFLKDIPWLGKLFSTTNVDTRKTELMLFITPHIISNTDDQKFITDQFKRKLSNLSEVVKPTAFHEDGS